MLGKGPNRWRGLACGCRCVDWANRAEDQCRAEQYGADGCNDGTTSIKCFVTVHKKSPVDVFVNVAAGSLAWIQTTLQEACQFQKLLNLGHF